MKSTINIKVDADLKIQAQQLAQSLGLSLSAVISGSLKKFIDRGGISFYRNSKISSLVEAELLEAQKDIHAGKNLIGPFDSDEALDEYFETL